MVRRPGQDQAGGAVADCTEGSGRYNLALGAVGMVAGIGATASTSALGYVAASLGFAWSFGAIAVFAAAAILVVWLLMPETVESAAED